MIMLQKFRRDSLDIAEAEPDTEFYFAHEVDKHNRVLVEALLSTWKFLMPDLQEPGRTVFWKCVRALELTGWKP